MATKKGRSNRHGHIRQRGPNTWQLLLEKPRGADGKRKPGSETVHGSFDDAQERLNDILKDIRAGTFVKTNDQRLGDFLDRWVAEKARASAKVNSVTADGYQCLIDRYVKRHPTIGDIPIGKLAPRHVEALYASLRSKDRAPQPVKGRASSRLGRRRRRSHIVTSLSTGAGWTR